MTNSSLRVRKWFEARETINYVNGRECSPLAIKAVCAAVVGNPLTGRYEANLDSLVDAAPTLSAELASRCLQVLGVAANEVSAYGKGAIVGLNGEIEHAAALIHPTFGAPVRAAIGGGAAIIPSTKVVAGAGFRLTMPVTNRHDIWSFDEMDAMSFAIDDAPHPDEIVIALVYATGGRPGHRIVKKA